MSEITDEAGLAFIAGACRSHGRRSDQTIDEWLAEIAAALLASWREQRAAGVELAAGMVFDAMDRPNVWSDDAGEVTLVGIADALLMLARDIHAGREPSEQVRANAASIREGKA